MLLANQFDDIIQPITDLYEEYNQTVINDIARRLAGMDMTSTAAWQMQRLTEAGAVYDDAIRELAKLTGRSKRELDQAFRRAGVRAMQFDDKIYRAAGLNPVPINLSPAMAQVLLAGLQKTRNIVNNLTMTTALQAQQSFIHAADLAYLQVSTGTMSYDQAIRMAVKHLASDGLSAILYPSGRADQLDVAMRRAVLTGVAQTTGALEDARANEMGQDLVQTSAHIGARPSHQEWQGKIFSRSGRSTKYPPLVESTGYGTKTGLCGINCRHSKFPYFEGLSQNAYDQATLDSYADRKVKYRGKEMSYYDATQVQREIERRIRKAKRQASAFEAAGLPNLLDRAKVKSLQAQMREFITETGLQRQYVRESVVK